MPPNSNSSKSEQANNALSAQENETIHDNATHTCSAPQKKEELEKEINSIRDQIGQYVKKGNAQSISIATALIKVDGEKFYYLAVSGKSWKGNSPNNVEINGKNYQVICTDNQSIKPNTFESASGTEITNQNHAEQKLFSHFNDTYKGKNAEATIAVQNTSISKPGMCDGCKEGYSQFKKENDKFDTHVLEFSTKENP